MKKLILLFVVLFVGSASAGSATWLGGSGNWDDASNWDIGIPTLDDYALIFEPSSEVTIDSDVACYIGIADAIGAESWDDRVKITQDGGSMDVPASGFNLHGYSEYIMNDGTWYSWGIMVGRNPGGKARLTMNGGSMSIGGNLAMGFDGATDSGVELLGGSISCNGLDFQNGYVNLEGGVLEIPNSVNYQSYIDDGELIAYGGTNPEAALRVTTLDSGRIKIEAVLVDPAWAFDPSPASPSGVVSPVGVTLSWSAGMGATSHDVYFGTASDALALIADDLGDSEYSFTTPLAFGTTYYWRVDENPAGLEGELWLFSTLEYISIEDFEAYDTSGNPIIDSWPSELDSWDSGSTVSLSFDPVNGGEKAMRLDYDNATPAYGLFSETTRTINADFTTNGVKAMDIWVMGDAANADDDVYVRLNDGSSSATVNLVDVNVLSADWQVTQIDLTALGLTLSNIETITIGVGDADNPVATGTGTIYVDDIALYPSRCIGGNPAGDINGDCQVNFLDLTDQMDNWLENNMWP